jgi:6-phosphogluconolactonase (cycloisomerase 2 family)
MHYDVDPAKAGIDRARLGHIAGRVCVLLGTSRPRHFYVASATPLQAVPDGTGHYVTAFAIDCHHGALSQIGDSIALPVRPIHIDA